MFQRSAVDEGDNAGAASRREPPASAGSSPWVSHGVNLPRPRRTIVRTLWSGGPRVDALV